MSCLSLVDCDPVCCGEPFVALDVVDAVLQVAVTFGQIHLQQVSQQVLQVGAEVGRESYLERRRNVVLELGSIFHIRSTSCRNHLKAKDLLTFPDTIFS